MGRQNISTGGPREGKLGYSRAVRVGASYEPYLALDGHDGIRSRWQGDPYAQTIPDVEED